MPCPTPFVDRKAFSCVEPPYLLGIGGAVVVDGIITPIYRYDRFRLDNDMPLDIVMIVFFCVYSHT